MSIVGLGTIWITAQKSLDFKFSNICGKLMTIRGWDLAELSIDLKIKRNFWREQDSTDSFLPTPPH